MNKRRKKKNHMCIDRWIDGYTIHIYPYKQILYEETAMASTIGQSVRIGRENASHIANTRKKK